MNALPLRVGRWSRSRDSHEDDSVGGTRRTLFAVPRPRARDRSGCAGPSRGQRLRVGNLVERVLDVQLRPGGLGAVHVYAYPVSGGAPLFVGYSIMDANPNLTPEQRHERPDLAAVLGGRYLTAGYKVSLSALPPGTYDLVVFALNARTGTGVDQRVVRVTIQ